MRYLKCVKCGHIWAYKGNAKIFLTCPACYKKVKLEDCNYNNSLKNAKDL